jgi:hypothetical protein
MTDLATLARAANIDLPRVAKPRAIDPIDELLHLATIAAESDPTAAKQAYARWLAEHGDPLGALALAGGAYTAMKQREEKLLAKHAAKLVGELAPWIEKGWLDVTWERGFLDRVEVRVEKAMGITGAAVMRALLAHPSARLLREIRIAGNTSASGWRDDFQELVDVLVETGTPVALRELAIAGVFGAECGDVSRVWNAFPALRDFWAWGMSITLGTIDAPALESMRFELGSLSDDNIESIAGARAPKLDTLILQGLELPSQLAALKPIFDAKTFPKLTTLVFSGVVEHGDKLVDAVLASKIAPRLKQLSLWNCELSKAAAKRLAARFPDAIS